MSVNEYHKEKAVLQASMITDWKRERGVYNFQTLPNKAIVALTHQVFSAELRLFSKNIKGINGKVSVEGDYVYCSGFGSGAPALVTLMEELQALGVSEFIFIGLCAALDAAIKPGSAFYVAQALSANGITASYYPGTMIVPYDLSFVQELAAAAGVQGIACCSTDSPFRETPSFLQEARTAGCRLIEMECAAAYAFAHFYKVKVACFLVVADQVGSAWTPPADMGRLLAMQQQLVRHIVKHNS